ncbi:MAG: efflux RND transporter periplasmic adaptor subunit [bacterium]
MARRIVPLMVVLLLVGYFGYRYRAQKKAFEEDRSFYGTVEAVEVSLSAQVTGRIVDLPVLEGERVEAGRLLVRIEDSVYRAQVDQARASRETALRQLGVVEANLAGLATSLARVRKLLSTGSATQMQLDDLETQKSVLEAQKPVIRSQAEQAEAALRLAQEQLGHTTVTAPLAGTILRIPVELGETVFPGSALLTLADLSNMEVKIYVPGPTLGRIRLGQKVELKTDSYADRIFPGAVATIADEAEFTPKNVQTREERVRLVYAVKVRVPNPDGTLKTGMPVDAWFVDAGAPPTEGTEGDPL